MALTFQHRFVASLVVMSLVVFVMTLATRNLVPMADEHDEETLPEHVLPEPSETDLKAIQLPHPDDLAPIDDDPMNLAVVVAVGLVSECMVDASWDYFLPIRVQLGKEGVIEARVEAMPEHVDGRKECIAAGIYANAWPPVHGAPRWIRFSLPPLGSES